MEDPDRDRMHESSIARRDAVLARRVRAYVGMGSNVGASDRTLASAVHALAALPGVRLRGVSRLYDTAPVGVVDQPRFRNAVAAMDAPAGRTPETGATALLVALKSIERAFGRRSGRRWGPRELDLDLIVFGRARLALERPPAGVSLDRGSAAALLEVPHPEARERLFVLAPLADLAPGLVPPGWGETVDAARRQRQRIEGADAARPIGVWDAASGTWTAPEASPVGA
jgi:2-amino-4-hydroxy-6-hydroxymethyldihydropteridine diphosphokinase